MLKLGFCVGWRGWKGGSLPDEYKQKQFQRKWEFNNLNNF